MTTLEQYISIAHISLFDENNVGTILICFF